MVFSAVMLTTGPIWAKPIWGTWWTWDARLTLTLFVFFLFIGYLALRAAVHDTFVGAVDRLSALHRKYDRRTRHGATQGSFFR